MAYCGVVCAKERGKEDGNMIPATLIVVPSLA
jgi:hypothetical protein